MKIGPDPPPPAALFDPSSFDEHAGSAQAAAVKVASTNERDLGCDMAFCPLRRLTSTML
jgi:hypothetical protein